MSFALVDVGSNTIRLTVYAAGDEAAKVRAKTAVRPDDDLGSFVRLFSKKIMAGLASYVDDGNCLTDEGIEVACDALRYLHAIVDNLQIGQVHVFATASLRNVDNSAEAVVRIEHGCGWHIELLSSEEEARLGYSSFQHDCPTDTGVMADIGGGSTELVCFEDGQVICAVSMPLGSLKLYKRCVGDVLPTPCERKNICKCIKGGLDDLGFSDAPTYEMLYGIGGTARAGAKLLWRLEGDESCGRTFSTARLAHLLEVLEDDRDKARKLILNVCPDRMHTVIPGLLVLQTLARRFGAEQIVVGQYGVREGYVYERIIG